MMIFPNLTSQALKQVWEHFQSPFRATLHSFFTVLPMDQIEVYQELES